MTATTTPVPRPRPGLRLAVVVAWSVIVWVALWGDVSAANVLCGVVLGLVTLRLVPLTSPDRRVPVRPLALLRLAGFFVWALVRASAVVAWEVVTPRNDINEGIVAIPLRTSSPGLMTYVANVVSLTPGTLTLEVRRDPPTLYIHVLHLRAIEDVRADIHRLEDVVLAAFGSEADEGGDR